MIFLVVGGLLYFVPKREIKADTTTTGNAGTDTRTSSARVTVPIGWAFASAIIGFVLLILGLAVPNPIIRSNAKKDSYDKVVESKENIEVGDGKKRRIVTERTEKHNKNEHD
ncbi:MAG: hypothetical protein V1837_01945 [Candidatus Woesearchaeota archaeon]